MIKTHEGYSYISPNKDKRKKVSRNVPKDSA